MEDARLQAENKRLRTALGACRQVARVLQLRLAGILDTHPNVPAASDDGWEIECYADDALRGEVPTDPRLTRKPPR